MGDGCENMAQMKRRVHRMIALDVGSTMHVFVGLMDFGTAITVHEVRMVSARLTLEIAICRNCWVPESHIVRDLQ